MDIQTLNYSIAMLSLSALIVSFFMFPKIKDFPGSIHWIFAVSKISIGTLLIGMRGMIPDFFSIYLANIFLIFAPSILIQSFKMLLDIPNRKKLEYWASGTFCVIFLTIAQVGSTRERILIFSFAHFFLWTWGGIALFTAKSALGKSLISAILIFMGILSFLRFATSWNIDTNQSLLQVKGFNALYMLLMLAFTFAIFSSYILLLNRKLMDTLVQEKESLFLANQSKEKLFRIIAHDLRGPLGTVLHGMEFAKIEDNIQEKNFLLDKIIAQTKILYLFLEKILDWVKTQEKGVVYYLTEIPVKEIILNEVKNCAGMAEEKQIEMLLPELHHDLRIFADQITSGAIIRNLLNNAIKFTPRKGSIRLTVQVNLDFVEIIIEDSGAGMSVKQIENFNKKYLLSSTFGTQGEAGHGLGLAICREYIDGNKGKIEFKQGENGGTKVSVFFPKNKK